DGYPRNEAQYRAYIGFDHPTAVVVIHVPREVSLERLAMRASHDTRSDDNPEATAKRLEIYERETLPMVDHFRAMDVVHDIDGNGTIDEVAEQIEKIFS
ncbi:nucleoside monophosphate kinase, partial [Candidatus Uhrbacteria bacterium]|nr:nucleoside monophosphate kinase [Candidatus Uhrbacteria bacterium]